MVELNRKYIYMHLLSYFFNQDNLVLSNSVAKNLIELPGQEKLFFPIYSMANNNNKSKTINLFTVSRSLCEPEGTSLNIPVFSSKTRFL